MWQVEQNLLVSIPFSLRMFGIRYFSLATGSNIRKALLGMIPGSVKLVSSILSSVNNTDTVVAIGSTGLTLFQTSGATKM